MNYIILVAGKGSRLHPITLKNPKSLYRLDKETTVIQRMVKLIRKHDKNAVIVLVTGFMHTLIENQIKDVITVYNPFYEITNSIASLWFAREYLYSDNVTIINGDIVMEELLVKDVICQNTKCPIVLLDSSIKRGGDYNVQVRDDRVLVMSKELESYFGEYAGVTKFDRKSSKLLYAEICQMLDNGFHDQWYENALVQMIFNNDFALGYFDINQYKWTEIDNVGDFFQAKEIHLK